MNYQEDFSKINKSVLDYKSRTMKAKKTLAIINDYLEKNGKKLNGMVCLDIGGSAGYIAKILSPYIKKVYVIDIDKQALKFGETYNSSKNIIYKVGDAMKLKFKDKSIDIVICNQVYEHVSNHNLLIKEIYRVLKNYGICYFSGNNRFIFIEPHYKLPILSWFPKRIANLYLKTFRGINPYYENHLSYYGLKKLLKPFAINDYTISVIKNPEKFYALDLIGNKSILTKFPNFLFNIIKPLFPGFIFILSKNK